MTKSCIVFGRGAGISIIGGGGGGGGRYSYIRVLPNYFLLKSIVFTICEHEYMNICPPPQLSIFQRLWFSANLVPQRWQNCAILDTAQSQAKLPSFLRVNYSTKIIFYGATQISTEPLKFLRSHSYFYGVSYISTESVIFLRSHSYFYGATHISTEPVIFLRSHSYFYGATQISTESLIFLRSQLYFHGARVFPWSIHISMKQPNFCKKCTYVLLCEAVSLVGHRMLC